LDRKQPQEIDLVKLALVLIRKLWLIVIVTVIFALLSFFFTKYFISPEYEAVSKLYVFNSSEKVTTGQVSSSDISTSKILVNTYIVILESDSVLGQVCDTISEYQGTEGYEYLGTETYTPARIRKMLSAASINSTESFQVVVTANDPYEAKFINDAILYYLPDEIIRVVKAGAVEIIDYASIPEVPSSPSILKNTALGGLLGFVLICGIIVVISLLDTRIHNEDDLEEEFKDIPILGTIPAFEANSRRRGEEKPKKTAAPPAGDDDDDDDWEED
jgi:capsular polysaccharide biosynthesis protein